METVKEGKRLIEYLGANLRGRNQLMLEYDIDGVAPVVLCLTEHDNSFSRSSRPEGPGVATSAILFGVSRSSGNTIKARWI